MRIVLLGDSHLARVRRDLPRVAGPDDEVVNAAVGGAFARDLLPQLAGAGAADVLVVSVGTNDAAPWKQAPLEDMVAALDAFLARADGRPLVYVVPPGVDEGRLVGAGDRTSGVVTAYAEAASIRFAEAGATLVEAPAILAPLGRAAFADDGLHLTGAAYDLLLPEIQAAVTRTARRPAT